MPFLFYKLTWISGKVIFETPEERSEFIKRNKEMLKGYTLNLSDIGY